MPVQMWDKRSINFGVNIQSQYAPHDRWFYDPWQLYARNSNNKHSSDKNPDPYHDESRDAVYILIENMLTRFDD